MEKIRVGVIGCGYWGPNLIRNFQSCPLTEVVGVYDASAARLEQVGRTWGHLKLVGTEAEFLDLPLDAVAIATPVSTHFGLAHRALERDLHVLVEKPLAATEREARALVATAARRDRVLMVDHTYLFTNAVRRIKELVDGGELGELYYVDGVRINLGLFQRDINVIWDLAPHDLSIVDYVLGADARSISAWGCAHGDPAVEDVAYVNVDYRDRLVANFHVNWLSPVKIRQMIFAGSRKSVIFNELNTTEPLKVYDRGVDFGADVEEVHKRLVGYRSGDVWSPNVGTGEALQGVVTEFANAIRAGGTPLSDGALGLRVVRMLEASTRSIRAQGGRVVLSNGVHANEVGHATGARGCRDGDLCTSCAGCRARTEREHSLLREPVRVPDRG